MIVKLFNGILLFVVLMLSSSCGTLQEGLDAQLTPYVNFYQTELEKAGCKKANLDFYSIKFDANINSNILGYCMRHPAGKVIRINAKYWQFLNDVDRHTLIAHEMHHCYFADNSHHPDSNHYMNATMPWLTWNVFITQLRYKLLKRCTK